MPGETVPLLSVFAQRPAAAATVSHKESEPPRPLAHRRLSAISNSNLSWASGCRHVLSLSSGVSTPRLTSPSPRDVAGLHAERQRLMGQLTTTGLQGPAAYLRLYDLSRDLLLRCVIFSLFENASTLISEALIGLRHLPKDELHGLFKEGSDIIHWREDTDVPPKASSPQVPLAIVGLILSARLLLGKEGKANVLRTAKNSISARQQLDKRFIALLLALATACRPDEQGGDVEALRAYCKPTLELLYCSRPKQHHARMQQLVKKIGRFMTQKRAEKFLFLPFPKGRIDKKDSALNNQDGDLDDPYLLVETFQEDGNEPNRCLASKEDKIDAVETSETYVECWLKKISPGTAP